MLILVTAASALIPSILLMWYFHSRDLFAEPASVLWRVFGLGILVVAPVLLVVWPIDPMIDTIASPIGYGLAGAFLTAAIPEELFKFVALWRYPLRHKEFDEPMDGVVYGVAVSLGFATFENILYVAGSGIGTAVIRALTAVPSHSFAGAIMGYYAGRARLEPGRRSHWLVRAIAIPTVLHGLYDFPLMAVERAPEEPGDPGSILGSLLLLVPIIVVVQWIWTLRLTRGLRAEQAHLLGLPAEPPPRRAVSVAMALGGGVLACAGALAALGLSFGLISGEIPFDDLGALFVVGGIFVLAPAGFGVFLVAAGMRRLNARETF